MSTAAQEFDIRCRGLACLAEEWQRAHREVQTVWPLEDFVGEATRTFCEAKHIFDYFATHGKMPLEIPFSYFAATIRRLVSLSKEFANLVHSFENAGHKVEGSGEFHKMMEFFEQVLAEDSFATDMAFSAGGLKDWD